MPIASPPRGELHGDGLAVEHDRPGRRRLDAEEGEADIGASGADQPGEAEHLAAMHVEADVLEDASRPSPRTESSSSPFGAGGRGCSRPISRPTMSAIAPARRRLGARPGGDQPPSRKTVTLSAISNTSSMRWLTKRMATPWREGRGPA